MGNCAFSCKTIFGCIYNIYILAIRYIVHSTWMNLWTRQDRSQGVCLF